MSKRLRHQAAHEACVSRVRVDVVSPNTFNGVIRFGRVIAAGRFAGHGCNVRCRPDVKFGMDDSTRSNPLLGSERGGLTGMTAAKRGCLATALLLSLVMFANGSYMLIAPSAWYFAVPGVTTTGPFNQHFIRDIGLLFLLLGGAYVLGVFHAGQRVLLWSVATFWLCGHALFHFWEVAVGICGVSAVSRDFPGVTLPALLGVALSVWAWLDARKIAR
jgi:hypothetical protein